MAKLYKYLSQQGGSTAPDATQENEHSPSSVSPFSCRVTKCGRCKCERGKSTIQGNKRFKAKAPSYSVPHSDGFCRELLLPKQ